jgi:hypothetical protein
MSARQVQKYLNCKMKRMMGNLEYKKRLNEEFIEGLKISKRKDV